MNGTLQHRAEQLAAACPPLLIDAERVAEAVFQGVHGRRRAGVGETFWQFRRYEAGDPVDRIDWRQSARTDRLFVREREWEAAQTACIWADCSGSMDYASGSNLPTKAIRGQTLMLALASLLLRGGEIVHWLDPHPVRAVGRNGLRNIAACMQQKGGKSLPPNLPVARHAHVILCSDFLMAPQESAVMLKNYAALNQPGTLVHILDPLENHFNLQGRVQLMGCEGEAPLLVPNAATVAVAYCQRMEAHKRHLARMAQAIGWNYIPHITDALPEGVLLQIYNLLNGKA